MSQKLACIARCKNEIHIIQKWIDSLPFVDHFFITDNESDDGTYEYLQTVPNVTVTRVKGFDEGRDFQILLKQVHEYKPDWVLKIDCDEIFEKIAIKNFHLLLDQTQYDAIGFRKFTFDYRLKENEYAVPKKFPDISVYLIKYFSHLDILNVHMHVGNFRAYKKLAISNFRIKHYTQPSYEKALEKVKTYTAVKGETDKREYSKKIIRDAEHVKQIRKAHFEEPEKYYIYPLDEFGLPYLVLEKENLKEKKTLVRKRYFVWKLKNLLGYFSRKSIFFQSFYFFLLKKIHK